METMIHDRGNTEGMSLVKLKSSVNIFFSRGRQNMVLFVSSETETALHVQLVFAKISK